MSDMDLAAGFPAADESRWLGLVEKVLGGRDFKRALVAETEDGLPIQPLYGQAGPGRHVGAGRNGWTVFQRVDHPDIQVANRFAIADLEGGAEGVELIFPGSVRAAGFGVNVGSVDDMDQLLADIDLTTTPLRIDAGYEIRVALACMAALLERRGIDPSAVDMVGLMDPVTGLLMEGRLIADYETIGNNCADIVHAIHKRNLNIRPLSVDARGVHGAGGSSAQQLAYALADAVELMRELEKRDVPLERLAPMLTFTLGVDADQFVSIAKLRAMRLIWARLQELCGLPPSKTFIHAQTGWRMMARRDPWVNILRATIGVSAATLGGADSCTVLPFTLPIGLPDSFARRIARNTQLVLREEAGLGRVADPAAGSGYVESLTSQLCEKAWDLFQEIEREGGLMTNVRSGAFQKRVIKVRRQRLAAIATRKTPVLGVSEFPLLKEVPVETLSPGVDLVFEEGRRLDLPKAGKGERFDAARAEFLGGATFADMAATVRSEWVRMEPLLPMRDAEPFEKLRDASDRMLKQTNRRPGIFLATIGPMAAFAARAGFARNAFEAGGIETLGGAVYEDVEALLASFADSDAKLSCICGTDEGYAGGAAGLAAALKAAGAQAVYLAGRPGDQAEVWKQAGIDAYVHAGCDILSILTDAHTRLGLNDDTEELDWSQDQ